MASGYHYVSGPYDLDETNSDGTNAIATLDALKASSGVVLPLTTGVKAVGVSLETVAALATATPVQHIVLDSGRTKFRAWVKTGTLATTEKHTTLDLSGTTGAMGIDADTATEDDFYIEKVEVSGTSGRAIVKFTDPAYLNPNLTA